LRGRATSIERITEWGEDFGDYIGKPEKFRVAREKIETSYAGWYYKLHFPLGKNFSTKSSRFALKKL
jgi:hypothetical protein